MRIVYNSYLFTLEKTIEEEEQVEHVEQAVENFDNNKHYYDSEDSGDDLEDHKDKDVVEFKASTLQRDFAMVEDESGEPIKASLEVNAVVNELQNQENNEVKDVESKDNNEVHYNPEEDQQKTARLDEYIEKIEDEEKKIQDEVNKIQEEINKIEEIVHHDEEKEVVKAENEVVLQEPIGDELKKEDAPQETIEEIIKKEENLKENETTIQRVTQSLEENDLKEIKNLVDEMNKNVVAIIQEDAKAEKEVKSKLVPEELKNDTDIPSKNQDSLKNNVEKNPLENQKHVSGTPTTTTFGEHYSREGDTKYKQNQKLPEKKSCFFCC